MLCMSYVSEVKNYLHTDGTVHEYYDGSWIPCRKEAKYVLHNVLRGNGMRTDEYRCSECRSADKNSIGWKKINWLEKIMKQ